MSSMEQSQHPRPLYRWKIVARNGGRWLGFGFGNTSADAVQEWRQVSIRSKFYTNADLVVTLDDAKDKLENSQNPVLPPLTFG